MAEEFDNIEDFESKETARKIPIGWTLLFIALILFGIYYVASYTPQISGWSQEREYAESVKK